jgi:hypothetical protein
MCVAEGGLDRFVALAATLPVICEPSVLQASAATTRADKDIDPVALAGRAQIYQDEQAKGGRTISFSEAVLTVRDQA